MATAPSIGRAVPETAGIAATPADATRALYERFSRQIFAYCLVQLRSREEAEDAVQTTFLNAFRAIERGVVPELESAWLYKIAQHVCLTRQRSSSRRRAIESPDGFNDDLLGAPVRNGDDAHGLTEALRELPEQQRRAILLREWQGLTYKEIAAEMEISQAAVETLIFRARRSLAQSLEKLRASSDMGSIAAAIKSLLVGAGTKVAVALVTVATTSVVAATPEARHQVIHFVNEVSQATIAPTKPDRPARTAKPARLVVVKTAPTVVAVAPVTRPTPAVHHAAKKRVEHAVEHTSAAEPSITTTPAATTPAPTPTPAHSVTTTTPAVTTPAVTTPATAVTPQVAPPAIGGFSPQSGTPGTYVQLSGHGFIGATTVKFYGVPADYVVNSDTQITAKVPAGAITGPITVVSPTAGDITSTASFTVNAPQQTQTVPVTTAASPSLGGFSPQTGTPGTYVQLSGHGFTGATAVKFNGVPADYAVNSDTQITAKVPSAAITGPITVVSPTAGDITSTASFTVTTATTTTTQSSSSSGDTSTTTTVTTAAPGIEGASPRTAQVGTSVLIVGKGFTGTTAVKFNGAAASFTINSDTQITAVVPTGATSGPFTVTTPNGTATSPGSFTVSTAAAPSITGFSPSSAAVGATVGIGGSGFTGATAVKFNGVTASFTVNSDGVITAVVPAGATSGPVSVTTPNGTGSGTPIFTVTH